MSDSSAPTFIEDADRQRDEGRRQGLAIAALALGLVSFVNLLGAEKTILAMVLAVIAMSGSTVRIVRHRAMIAIGLSVLQVVTILFVLLAYLSRPALHCCNPLATANHALSLKSRG